MPVEPRLQRLTLLLATMAACAAGSALAPPDASTLRAAAPTICWCAVAWVVQAFAIRNPTFRIPTWAAAGLWIALLFTPMLIEPMRRSIAEYGSTSELLLVAGLRNLTLGLAACSSDPLRMRTAGACSLFLLLFGAALGDGPVLVGFVALYSAIAVAWLAELYWSSLKLPSGARGKHPAVVALIVALAGSFVLIETGPRRLISPLAEFIASSGGTSERDPFGQGGVGDGDDLVRTRDRATSEAPIDTDVMVESHRSALDDVISETRGEPKKRKGMQYAEARATPKVSPEHSRADAKKAGREFTTQRQRPSPPKTLAKTEKSGDLYVQGPTPAHLPLQAWDEFDGVEWKPDDTPAVAEAVIRASDGWLSRGSAGRNRAESFGPLVQHRIKVVSIKTQTLPTPPHMREFKLNNASYSPHLFRAPISGRIALAVDDPDAAVPAGTVIDTQCAAEDPKRLRSVKFPPASDESGGYLTRTNDERIGALAAEWTDGVPHGWRQIEAVAAHLRENYTLDPICEHKDECADTVSRFLFETKAGRDYDFAGAAVLLLRSLERFSK